MFAKVISRQQKLSLARKEFLHNGVNSVSYARYSYTRTDSSYSKSHSIKFISGLRYFDNDKCGNKVFLLIFWKLCHCSAVSLYLVITQIWIEHSHVGAPKNFIMDYRKMTIKW